MVFFLNLFDFFFFFLGGGDCFLWFGFLFFIFYLFFFLDAEGWPSFRKVNIVSPTFTGGCCRTGTCVLTQPYDFLFSFNFILANKSHLK